MPSGFVHYSITICSFISCILNSALIPVIYFKSSRDIGSYKYLLLSYTFVELLYTIFTLFTVPIFSPSQIGWIFYASVSYFPQFWSTLMIFGFTSCFLMLALILMYSFSYRYFVFCRPQKLIWFRDPKRISFLVAMLLITTFLYEAYLYTTSGPSPALGARYNVTDADLNVAGYIAIPIFTLDGHLELTAITVFTQWGVAIILSAATIVTVIYKMRKQFKNINLDNSSSEQLHKLQKTLFTLLILQTMVPVVFSFIPVLCSYMLPYFGRDASFLGLIYSLMLPFAQLIDPILIILFIRDYRVAFFGYFRQCIPHKIEASMTSFSYRLTSAFSTKNTTTSVALERSERTHVNELTERTVI